MKGTKEHIHDIFEKVHLLLLENMQAFDDEATKVKEVMKNKTYSNKNI